MSVFVKNVLLLLAGVALGWSLHAVLVPNAPSTEAPRYVIEQSSPPQSLPFAVTEDEAPVLAQPQPGDRPQHFRMLLDQQQFEEAVTFYTDSLYLGEEYRLQLRPIFDDYLNTCLRQCGDGIFTSLVDAWLDSYYEDIPVLLLLAQYQHLQGFHEEAIQVIHRAMTYAYEDGQRQQVSKTLRSVVLSTDKTYGVQQRWIELLGFYELVAALSLEEPAYGLRRASLYHTLGEPERARQLLLDLQGADNGLDAELSQALAKQLGNMEPDTVAQDLPADGIPLLRRGDHFLVEVILNDRDRVVLMIDTGASVTSLSRSAFDRLAGSRFVHNGSRLFNTANGMARGDVYSAESLTLGAARLGDVQVAVLDYDPAGGVDGLLGMNVLRNYRFEIDQDREQLYLRPR